MSEARIVQLLEEQNALLTSLLDLLDTTGIAVRKPHKHHDHTATISDADKEELDSLIDLDDWFNAYGESPYPAKYMLKLQGMPFTTAESRYMFNRLCEVASVNAKVGEKETHVFTFVGKKYCQVEANTMNCFACVPVSR